MSRKTVRLSSVTTKIGSGSTPRGGKSVYVREGTAFIRSQNVQDNRFVFEGLARISDRAAEQLRGVSVAAEDVLICITGESVARTCLAPAGAMPARVSQHVAILRPDPEVLDARFLLYSLLEPRTKAYLNMLSQAGATRRALTKGNLEDLEILVPPIDTQREIARVLGVLDRLITVNDQLVRHLDAFGSALLRSLARERLTLLSRADEDGWKASTVGDVTVVVETGKRPKGGVRGILDGVPSIGAESISGLASFDFKKVKYVPAEFADSMRTGVLNERNLLVYKDGGKPGDFRPKVGFLGDGFPFASSVINEHVYRVKTADLLSDSFLYFWLSQPEILAEMRKRGTGVAVPGLNSTALKGVPVAIPPTPVREWLYPALDVVVGQALACASESRDLASARDELLPLLLSGRVLPREVR